jgi:hypothetical protein
MVTRMLERALENTQLELPGAGDTVVPLRFARDPEHFATASTRRDE